MYKKCLFSGRTPPIPPAQSSGGAQRRTRFSPSPVGGDGGKSGACSAKTTDEVRRLGDMHWGDLPLWGRCHKVTEGLTDRPSPPNPHSSSENCLKIQIGLFRQTEAAVSSCGGLLNANFLFDQINDLFRFWLKCNLKISSIIHSPDQAQTSSLSVTLPLSLRCPPGSSCRLHNGDITASRLLYSIFTCLSSPFLEI